MASNYAACCISNNFKMYQNKTVNGHITILNKIVQLHQILQILRAYTSSQRIVEVRCRRRKYRKFFNN